MPKNTAHNTPLAAAPNHADGKAICAKEST